MLAALKKEMKLAASRDEEDDGASDSEEELC